MLVFGMARSQIPIRGQFKLSLYGFSFNWANSEIFPTRGPNTRNIFKGGTSLTLRYAGRGSGSALRDSHILNIML